MNKLGHRFSNFALSLLATVVVLIGSVPLVPSAYGITVNTGINEAGDWYRAGPGVVFNETNAPGEDLYIIRHQAPSLARYEGDIPGLAATSPRVTGVKRLDVDTPASQAYLSYLASLHNDLASAISSKIGRQVEIAHRYDAVLNGIAVSLNPTEAQAVSSLSGIRSITRDYSRELHTDNGPKWIGADEIWGAEQPADANTPAWCAGGNCGEGIVAGIIDTGVNFNHPSFADIGGDGYDHQAPLGMLTYKGACSAQPVGTPGFCNDKLIGYYDFTGTGPEDDNGHGSHTASTTAGNVLNITLKGETIDLDRSIAGVAPHANIISYKGCSGTPVGCLISALLGAINAATLDEVDVINYSIGGASSNPWADLDAQAFFDAYEAGIFVATSASNDGPGFGTLGSPADAPWVTSVGASTHNRKLANGVVSMAGGDTAVPADIIGKGITAAYPSADYPYMGNTTGTAPIVYAGDYGNALCGAGTADPATGAGTDDPFPPSVDFAGAIVVCDRGTYGRVAKGAEVAENGAGGYVLANDAANGDSLVADNHVLPGVHISFNDGVTLKAWLATGAGHVGRIGGLVPGEDANAADVMASFSSRGANPAAPSVIKPDVTAPGVDILAAWMAAPEVTLQDILLQGSDGEQYNIISGTSMSSPHTAGSGALLRAVHPEWTPDEVKSALMTTAFTTMANGNNGEEVHGVLKEDASTPADPFDMGAGRVDLHVAADAAFVLDVGPAAYEAANPGIGGDVTTLNMASLGNDRCGEFDPAGTCSWTRTIRSTALTPVLWTIAGTGESGMTVSASPNAFTLNPGAEQTIVFTADTSASPKGAWIFGEARFTPAGASVPPAHFPVAVIPRTFGGGGEGLDLFLHGNVHDYCESTDASYTGDGAVDAVNECIDFLSEDPLDTAEAATWGPLQPGLNGPAFDPRWVWDLSATEDVQLGGPMVVELWASQATTDTGVLFDTNIDVTLIVDGNTEVLDFRTAHVFQTPGVPQLLRMVVPVPQSVASDSVELIIEPVFIDTGNTVTFYYDSENPCSPSVDGSCDSRVSMPVADQPLAPIAKDDFVFINNGETVTIDVLANDFDPEGGPLALEIISGPSNGTADVTTGNAISYTHDGSTAGSDTIVYRVTDNQGLTAEATVTITIAGNCTSAPDFFDNFEGDDMGWTVDTAVLVDPTSNTWDRRADLGTSSFVNSYNTDALAQDPITNADTTKDVRLVSPSFLVSGSSQLKFFHRFFTEDGFDGGVLEISTDDGLSWSDIEDAGGSFVQGGYNSTLSAGDMALAARDAWSGQSDTWPDAMEEVIVDLAPFAEQDVRVRFRLGQDVLLGVGFPGVAGWFIDDVSVTNLFSDCDDPVIPPTAVNDTDTVSAGGSVTTNVRANDTDNNPDTGDIFVKSIVTPPQHGTASIVDDGLPGDAGNTSVEYTHTGTFETSDSYEYRIEDPDGSFAIARVEITIVQPNNETPVANDDTGTVNAGESATIDVRDNDVDDQGKDNLSVTIETAPQSGFAGVNGDGTVTYTHSGDGATSDSFEYRVTDQFGAFDTATVMMTIIQDNTGGEGCRNDLCADDDSDKPAELTLTYLGGSCSDSANSQGSKADCVDHVPGGASGPVIIRATSKEDDDADSAKVYFEGLRNEGESFTIEAINAGEEDFGSKVFLHLYDTDGNLLQTIEIHTSCSEPLVEGERFGSLMLGDSDTDPNDPICTAGEGRVHGSGYWDDDNMDSDSDKVHFSFDAKVYKGGYKGKLKIRDKFLDLKIDAKTITSLSTGAGEVCDGAAMDTMTGDTFLFTATGKMEVGDDEVENAEFRACGADNGKNKDAPYDNLYVECTANCLIPGYNTGMGPDNDIDGGNIHLHDAIVDPVADESGAAAASSPDSGTQSVEGTGGDAPASSGEAPAASGESTDGSSAEPEAASEPAGSPDVVTLEPMLLTKAPVGTPMVVTAILETHGDVAADTPIELRWKMESGLTGSATALVNEYGIAAFVVTVPAGSTHYTAVAGEVESNGMNVTGF